MQVLPSNEDSARYNGLSIYIISNISNNHVHLLPWSGFTYHYNIKLIKTFQQMFLISLFFLGVKLFGLNYLIDEVLDIPSEKPSTSI